MKSMSNPNGDHQPLGTSFPSSNATHVSFFASSLWGGADREPGESFKSCKFAEFQARNLPHQTANLQFDRFGNSFPFRKGFPRLRDGTAGKSAKGTG
jgi:hypothetical protein